MFATTEIVLPAGEDRDGGVLSGGPHEDRLVVHTHYLTGVDLKQRDQRRDNIP